MTVDQISLDRLALLHPKVRAEAIELYKKASDVLTSKAQIRIVQGYRTFPEQQALYDQGRTTPGAKVTKAKAGQSYHNYGLAFDYALLVGEKVISWDVSKDWDGDGVADWMEVMKVFEDAGWKSGKSFNDMPHLEKSFGLSWKGLLAKHDKGDLIPGTTYVNI